MTSLELIVRTLGSLSDEKPNRIKCITTIESDLDFKALSVTLK